MSPAADPLAWATPRDPPIPASGTQPLFATSALRAACRRLATREFVLGAIPILLIVGIYAAYSTGPATPDPAVVASQSINAQENAPTATSAAPGAGESEPVEPERIAALRASIPTINPAVPNATRVPVESKPVEPEIIPPLRGPIATTNPAAPKRASALQRPVPAVRAPVAATASVKHSLAGKRVDGAVAKLRTAPQPHPWQAMHVSLTRCNGDLIARIVCELRVRGQFCAGHWGEAPECASGIINDHGQ